ncbi:hypothetical protein F2P79_000675 [Pimephales promelas]|nr:hypothetical protein F2P79_000675 [Pimephales promelas]
MSRDQCSEHSRVKWRGFQCSGLGAGQAQLCVGGVQGDRQERGRQAESGRRAGAVGSACGELRNAPLAPQLPTEPVVFMWQRTPRLPTPQDLQLLWSAPCLGVLVPSLRRVTLLAL